MNINEEDRPLADDPRRPSNIGVIEDEKIKKV
jgi:hypothetical protein